MIPFRVAAAQVPSQRGDVERNVATHIAAIEAAARHGVSLLVFPELSLTGYEPSMLRNWRSSRTIRGWRRWPNRLVGIASRPWWGLRCHSLRLAGVAITCHGSRSSPQTSARRDRVRTSRRASPLSQDAFGGR